VPVKGFERVVNFMISSFRDEECTKKGLVSCLVACQAHLNVDIIWLTELEYNMS